MPPVAAATRSCAACTEAVDVMSSSRSVTFGMSFNVSMAERRRALAKTW